MGKFTMTLSRQYANQTFTVSTVVEFAESITAQEKLSMTDKAQDQLIYLADRYAANGAPRQSSPDKADGSAGQQPAANEQVYKEKGIKFFTEVSKGRKYCKVTTTGASEHGMTVWPEVMDAANLTENDFPIEGKDASGYTVTYVRNPQGRKVTRIELDF